MAITSEIIPNLPVGYYPSGYTVPTQSVVLDDPNEKAFTVDIDRSGVEDADPATGMDQLMTAIKNHVDTVLVPDDLELDAAASVESVIFVDSIEEVNTANTAKDQICATANNVIRCRCRYKWETAG